MIIEIIIFFVCVALFSGTWAWLDGRANRLYIRKINKLREFEKYD